MSGATPVVTDPIKFNRSANDVDVSADGKILVSYNGGNLYVSHNNGLQFIKNSFPDVNRAECVISETNSNIMYASMAAREATASAPFRNCLYGIFRSNDGGIRWKRISPAGTASFDMFANPGTNCQGTWDNAISIYPDNDGKIVVGGIVLYRWEQSSVDPAPVNGSWEQIDVRNEFFPNGNLNPFFVHADKHRIVFDPRNSDVAYIATDGGMYKSLNFNDAFPLYSNFNLKYAATQYYNLGVGPNDVVLAGSQDNSSHLVGLNFNNNLGAIQVLSLIHI